MVVECLLQCINIVLYVVVINPILIFLFLHFFMQSITPSLGFRPDLSCSWNISFLVWMLLMRSSDKFILENSLAAFTTRRFKQLTIIRNVPIPIQAMLFKRLIISFTLNFDVSANTPIDPNNKASTIRFIHIQYINYTILM